MINEEEVKHLKEEWSRLESLASIAKNTSYAAKQKYEYGLKELVAATQLDGKNNTEIVKFLIAENLHYGFSSDDVNHYLVDSNKELCDAIEGILEELSEGDKPFLERDFIVNCPECESWLLEPRYQTRIEIDDAMKKFVYCGTCNNEFKPRYRNFDKTYKIKSY